MSEYKCCNTPFNTKAALQRHKNSEHLEAVPIFRYDKIFVAIYGYISFSGWFLIFGLYIFSDEDVLSKAVVSGSDLGLTWLNTRKHIYIKVHNSTYANRLSIEQHLSYEKS